jgi:molecular chaperone DnaK
MDEETIVGIDLGTTNSAVGVVEAGFPILLADEEGRRLVPSAVRFEGDEAQVGHAALRRRGIDRVVTSAKRLIGRRWREVEDSVLPWREGSSGRVEIDAGSGRMVTPEEVSAEVLRTLKHIAEGRLEHEVKRAVITVPAYFNDAQRAATKRAGELAGLSVERLVAEPTAAALAYGLDRLGESSRVVVFDLGGGTFDVSILELREGVFEVLSTAGDTRLGGDDFDGALAADIAAKEAREGAGELQLARMREEAERVKCRLSDQPEEVFRVPFIEDSHSIERIVRRDDFERLLAPFLDRMAVCAERALLDARLDRSDLDAVVLVGGRSLASKLFGREPDVSQHPDEAVALGAAIQAGILSGRYRQVLLLDVTPLSLGIETFGGLMNVLIPRNTTIPCKAGEMFTNARDGQRSVRVRVLQGEREMANDNWDLGRFDVEFDAAPRGKARVGVQFALDENGILEVLARDVGTGRDTRMTIESAAVDVNDEAVERMIDESVDHAFEDMNARVMTEARIKAEELLPSVETALRDLGAALSGPERNEIESARAAVESAMAGDSAPVLKEAVESLDRATEALAARLVDAAMAEHLRGQGEIPEDG